ncbi:MAG: HypC/HybG/HupF family hydrogenase formation chaperone [Candidatus Parcubacteria bacterium]|nr:HypC/HybG/HupF family hydrogenase formation chaperone [Candidatus Parcubacteria bacterium]
MCLTIPGKIKQILGKNAIIEVGKKNKEIKLNLLSDLKLGDWVLTLHDLAVEKISAQDAQKIINLYKYGQNK